MPSWERITRLADLSDRSAVPAERHGHALCLSLADGSPVAIADAAPIAARRCPVVWCATAY